MIAREPQPNKLSVLYNRIGLITINWREVVAMIKVIVERNIMPEKEAEIVGLL